MQNWVTKGCSSCFPSINPPTPSLSEFPLETGLTWARQAVRQCWPGKHSTVLCSMLAAAENTHGPEQMAAEEGDGLTDKNCRGYPTWEFSQARVREREANLTSFSVRVQRGFRRDLLLFFSDIHHGMKVKTMKRCESMSAHHLYSHHQTVWGFINGPLSVKLWRALDYRNSAGHWLPTEKKANSNLHK